MKDKGRFEGPGEAWTRGADEGGALPRQEASAAKNAEKHKEGKSRRPSPLSLSALSASFAAENDTRFADKGRALPAALALLAAGLAAGAALRADTTAFGTVATNTPIYTASQADAAFVKKRDVVCGVDVITFDFKTSEIPDGLSYQYKAYNTGAVDAMTNALATAAQAGAAAKLDKTAIQAALSGIDAEGIGTLQAAIDRLAALIEALKGVGE